MSGKGVCYDCPDRWVTEKSRCDADCKRYRAYREEYERQKERERRAKAADADAIGFMVASIEKTTRHHSGRRRKGNG